VRKILPTAKLDWFFAHPLSRCSALALIGLAVLAITGPRSSLVEAAEPARKSPAAKSRVEPSWPQFRGPSGQGQAGDADLPLTWSESENLLWKTFVFGTGWSSPVISGNDLWLTATTEANKGVRALRIDCATGEIVVRTKPLFEIDRREKIAPKNTYATPTPVLDGDRVFVHFGANGTACLDRDGNVLWKQVISYYHHHGPASSPVLAAGTLVIICDGFNRPFYDQYERKVDDDLQFVVGLDARTGEIRWKTPRNGQHSYSTPLVMEVAGKTQVVCPGGDGVWAYDPEDGKELWSCRFTGHSVIPCPVTTQGMIFVCTGYYDDTLLAIRQGGSGDCTKTHVAWRLTKGVPHESSPIVAGNHLFLASDDGILSCVAPQTGKVVWKQRLGGHFGAAPIVVGDRLYLLSDDGTMHVVRAAAKYEELARNQLPGKFLASPAVAGSRLYLRSDHYLYCIGEDADEEADPPPAQARRAGGAAGKPVRRDSRVKPANGER
jgi:outer membrane protein assembly factor BamB